MCHENTQSTLADLEGDMNTSLLVASRIWECTSADNWSENCKEQPSANNPNEKEN